MTELNWTEVFIENEILKKYVQRKNQNQDEEIETEVQMLLDDFQEACVLNQMQTLRTLPWNGKAIRTEWKGKDHMVSESQRADSVDPEATITWPLQGQPHRHETCVVVRSHPVRRPHTAFIAWEPGKLRSMNQGQLDLTLDGHEFEQTLRENEGQGSLARCSPWGHKESNTT